MSTFAGQVQEQIQRREADMKLQLGLMKNTVAFALYIDETLQVRVARTPPSNGFTDRSCLALPRTASHCLTLPHTTSHCRLALPRTAFQWPHRCSLSSHL